MTNDKTKHELALDKACATYCNAKINNGDIKVEDLVNQTITAYLDAMGGDERIELDWEEIARQIYILIIGDEEGWDKPAMYNTRKQEVLQYVDYFKEVFPYLTKTKPTQPDEEVVERVAKAIATSDADDYGTHGMKPEEIPEFKRIFVEQNWGKHIKRARCAIAALTDHKGV